MYAHRRVRWNYFPIQKVSEPLNSHWTIRESRIEGLLGALGEADLPLAKRQANCFRSQQVVLNHVIELLKTVFRYGRYPCRIFE